MSFELDVHQVGEVYETHLRQARDALGPYGSGHPMADADRAKLRRAHNMAVKMTQKAVTTEEWRRYRSWQTELGPPRFENGERIRRTRSGVLRVDRIDS